MLPAWIGRVFSRSIAVFLPQYLGRFLGYLLFHQIIYKANIKTFSCRDAVATIFLVLTRVSGGGSVASSKATVSYEDPALPAT